MISLNNISVQFGGKFLYDELSFMIKPNNKIGLVGKNGAGKSTLLKVLNKELIPESGEVSSPKGYIIGYLPQEMNHNEDSVILDEVKDSHIVSRDLAFEIENLNRELSEREDYESDSYLELLNVLSDKNDTFNIIGGNQIGEEAERILLGLGFNEIELTQKMSEFSGGWKMRVELAKILLQKPNLVLLDEPTNHLDIESIVWLEQFLKTYPGEVILISHDRSFLDSVTKRTIEISGGKAYDYNCSFTEYQKRREIEREQLIEEQKNQQKYIKETEQLINKFRAKKNKASFAQSLIKKLDRLDVVELDNEDNSKISLSFPPSPHSGKIVIEATDLTKNFPNKNIFNKAEFIIARGEKIALLGKNGMGKSTLIKMLVGDEQFEGSMKLGHNVNVGYFAQDEALKLDVTKTVFETIDDIAVGDARKNVRTILGSFMFSGEDVDKQVKVLSGGEKMRLAFCKLLLKPYNFLVLDEPTNHLDIKSKEVLKKALNKFEGTILLVSHDRDFLDGLTDKIFEIVDSRIAIHHYSLTEFLKLKKSDDKKDVKPVVTKEAIQEKKKESSYEERKKINKLKSKSSKLELKIEELESSISTIEAKLSEIDYSNEEYTKVLEKYNALKLELDTTFESWENIELEIQNITID